jgi:hypothetical protein
VREQEIANRGNALVSPFKKNKNMSAVLRDRWDNASPTI